MPGIGAAVYEVLAADTAVAAILGTASIPRMLSMKQPLFLTRSMPSHARTKTATWPESFGGMTAEVTGQFLTATYKQAQDLLREGRRTLNAMAGTHASKTIDAAQVTDGSDTPSGPIERDDQQTFQADLTVNLLYRE
jgi:hypothetical protein